MMRFFTDEEIRRMLLNTIFDEIAHRDYYDEIMNKAEKLIRKLSPEEMRFVTLFKSMHPDLNVIDFIESGEYKSIMTLYQNWRNVSQKRCRK